MDQQQAGTGLAEGVGNGPIRLSGAADTLVSTGYWIDPSIGLEWTLKALIVVVLAGLGSVFGTFEGGLFLGVAEAMSGATFGRPYRKVGALFIAIVL